MISQLKRKMTAPRRSSASAINWHWECNSQRQTLRSASSSEFSYLEKTFLNPIIFCRSGFVSEIYLVKFTSPPPPASRLPPAIVVKFYNVSAPKSETGFEVVDSQLNNLFADQAGLGPAILLILRDAIVMEYVVGGEQLAEEHDRVEAIREEIARKLARFHAIRSPLGRNQHAEIIRQMFSVWMSVELIEEVYQGVLRGHLERLGLPHLLATNLQAEADFVHAAIRAADQADPVIVFSHNDFNHLNLLVATDPATSQPTVRFIDFDFSTYFYRGADLGRYFVDCQQPEQFHPNELVPDEVMLQFFGWYREESGRLHGAGFLEEARNSPEELLKEAKLFALYAFLVDIIFCIFMAVEMLKAKDEDKMVDFLRHGDTRYAGYLKAKARFLQDGSLP